MIRDTRLIGGWSPKRTHGALIDGRSDVTNMSGNTEFMMIFIRLGEDLDRKMHMGFPFFSIQFDSASFNGIVFNSASGKSIERRENIQHKTCAFSLTRSLHHAESLF